MQVYLLNENGKQGYIAILDSVSRDGRRNAVKYMGAKYGIGFPVCPSTVGLRVKTVRTSAEFGKYMKLSNPGLMVNPIQVGPFVYDMPFIHYGAYGVVQWMPHFEKTVSESSFRAVSGGAIIEYSYQEPIFISALHMKRHVSAANSERLLVNVQNGYTTRELSAVDGNVFCEGTYHVENGVWTCDSLVKTPIAGWKSR